MSKYAMQEMGKKVQAMLPKELGFCILVFPFKAPGTANYISNARREDMIKSLRETADMFENMEDFETPDNNMY